MSEVPERGTPDVLTRRYTVLRIVYERMLVDLVELGSGELRLDTTLLWQVVKNYFIWLEGVKHVNGITHADPIKQASYMARWITHIQPIQARDVDNLNAVPLRLTVNCHFAIRVMCAALRVELEDVDNRVYSELLHKLRLDGTNGEDLIPFCSALVYR